MSSNGDHDDTDETENPPLQRSEGDFGGLVKDWSSLAKGWSSQQQFEAWKLVHELHRDTNRAGIRIRYLIAIGSMIIFMFWIITALISLLFFNGDLKSILAIGSFVTGPPVLVLGYYFGSKEKRRRPHKPSE